MRAWMRWGAVGMFAAIIGACSFGFAATFEPLPPAERWTWRTVYLLAAVASILGAIRPLLCQCRRALK